MPPDDEVRVRHLVEAANKAVSYAAGASIRAFDQAEHCRTSVISCSSHWRVLASSILNVSALTPPAMGDPGSRHRAAREPAG